MTMKLINKLRSITHTLSMGMLFKPHQDPTVCPEHGPMAGITGPANPDIDPDKMWDTIYYCPECLQEEQEAEKKALTEDSEKSDNFNWPAPRTDLFATRTEEIEDALKHHCMSPEQRKAYTEELEAEKKATPPEERTDIFYEDDDSVIKGWYHKTEDGDMRGPYPTRDEALIELGESIANRKENEVAHLHMTQDSEKSDNTELFTELFKLNDIVTAVYTLEKHQRGSYPLMTAGREYRICSVSQIVNQSNPQWAKPTYETSYRLVDTNEEAIYRPSFDGNHFEATGVEKWQECDHDYRTPWIKENHLCAVVQLEKTIQSLAIQKLGDEPVGAQEYLDDNLWLENAGKVDLPFKDREPRLMRGAPMTNDEDCCRPWVSPDDPHVHDPQTYTNQDLLELGMEYRKRGPYGGGDSSLDDGGPQPLRLCGFCKSQLPDIEYNDGINFAWLTCPKCSAANWVGGDD